MGGFSDWNNFQLPNPLLTSKNWQRLNDGHWSFIGVRVHNIILHSVVSGDICYNCIHEQFQIGLTRALFHINGGLLVLPQGDLYA